jgi:hypothetical protein
MGKWIISLHFQFAASIVAFFVAVYCIKVPTTFLPTIDELVASENVVLTSTDIKEYRQNMAKKKKLKKDEKSVEKKKKD